MPFDFYDHEICISLVHDCGLIEEPAELFPFFSKPCNNAFTYHKTGRTYTVNLPFVNFTPLHLLSFPLSRYFFAFSPLSFLHSVSFPFSFGKSSYFSIFFHIVSFILPSLEPRLFSFFSAFLVSRSPLFS